MFEFLIFVAINSFMGWLDHKNYHIFRHIMYDNQIFKLYLLRYYHAINRFRYTSRKAVRLVCHLRRERGIFSLPIKKEVLLLLKA